MTKPHLDHRSVANRRRPYQSTCPRGHPQVTATRPKDRYLEGKLSLMATVTAKPDPTTTTSSAGAGVSGASVSGASVSGASVSGADVPAWPRGQNDADYSGPSSRSHTEHPTQHSQQPTQHNALQAL